MSLLNLFLIRAVHEGFLARALEISAEASAFLGCRLGRDRKSSVLEPRSTQMAKHNNTANAFDALTIAGRMLTLRR